LPASELKLGVARFALPAFSGGQPPVLKDMNAIGNPRANLRVAGRSEKEKQPASNNDAGFREELRA
jgi:hypothetical protein